MDVAADDGEHAGSVIDRTDSRRGIDCGNEQGQHEQDDPQQVVTEPRASQDQRSHGASTHRAGRDHGGGAEETPVSLGYDRIRFLGPVYFGDTITVDYRITAVDPARRRSTASIERRIASTRSGKPTTPAAITQAAVV